MIFSKILKIKAYRRFFFAWTPKPVKVNLTEDIMSRLLTILAIVLFLALMVNCTGYSGADGAKGDQGIPGKTPTITLLPATETQCPTGGSVITVNGSQSVICNGAVGSPGAPGLSIVGPSGPQGPAGQPGAPGTQISIVQFCSGTTTYPLTFAEVGFCIDGNLYATYSANDGFSSLIPPGQYSSNGINSSCTFTVGAQCRITQQ